MINRDWVNLKRGDAIHIPPGGYQNRQSNTPLNLRVTRSGQLGFNISLSECSDWLSVSKFVQAIIMVPDTMRHTTLSLAPKECELGNNNLVSWMYIWLGR